jgi:HNH endonuclease
MPEPLTAPMCSGCGKHGLTPEWDSDAHIFPNALGGRLAPSGLICRECNTLLNDLADNPLVKAFGAWPTLVNLPRQNGKHPPATVETTGGQRIRVEADGTRSLDAVVYDRYDQRPGWHQRPQSQLPQSAIMSSMSPSGR